MKLKTNKAAAKRVKVKKNMVCRKKAYKRHLNRHKTTKQLRRLSGPAQISVADTLAFKNMLPYVQ
jgi:ribosomal protein L35|tara:strand:+ start:174 stop:368 length:195 start_codon:yes stop_codon:yes gene_type:complete